MTDKKKTPFQNPNTKYLWIDLETTGLDEAQGFILEYACILTDSNFNILDSCEDVTPFHSWEEYCTEFVLNMHEKSGLSDALVTSLLTYGNELVSGDSAMYRMEAAILHWLKDWIQTDDPIVIAGSGVSHFDMRWLRYHMSESFMKKFYYSPLDIGALENWCEVMEVLTPEGFINENHSNHRALDDIKQALNEANAVKNFLTMLWHPIQPGTDAWIVWNPLSTVPSKTVYWDEDEAFRIAEWSIKDHYTRTGVRGTAYVCKIVVAAQIAEIPTVKVTY